MFPYTPENQVIVRDKKRCATASKSSRRRAGAVMGERGAHKQSAEAAGQGLPVATPSARTLGLAAEGALAGDAQVVAAPNAGKAGKRRTAGAADEGLYKGDAHLAVSLSADKAGGAEGREPGRGAPPGRPPLRPLSATLTLSPNGPAAAPHGARAEQPSTLSLLNCPGVLSVQELLSLTPHPTPVSKRRGGQGNLETNPRANPGEGDNGRSPPSSARCSRAGEGPAPAASHTPDPARSGASPGFGTTSARPRAADVPSAQHSAAAGGGGGGSSGNGGGGGGLCPSLARSSGKFHDVSGPGVHMPLPGRELQLPAARRQLAAAVVQGTSHAATQLLPLSPPALLPCLDAVPVVAGLGLAAEAQAAPEAGAERMPPPSPQLPPARPAARPSDCQATGNTPGGAEPATAAPSAATSAAVATEERPSEHPTGHAPASARRAAVATATASGCPTELACGRVLAAAGIAAPRGNGRHVVLAGDSAACPRRSALRSGAAVAWLAGGSLGPPCKGHGDDVEARRRAAAAAAAIFMAVPPTQADDEEQPPWGQVAGDCAGGPAQGPAAGWELGAGGPVRGPSEARDPPAQTAPLGAPGSPLQEPAARMELAEDPGRGVSQSAEPLPLPGAAQPLGGVGRGGALAGTEVLSHVVAGSGVGSEPAASPGQPHAAPAVQQPPAQRCPMLPSQVHVAGRPPGPTQLCGGGSGSPDPKAVPAHAVALAGQQPGPTQLCAGGSGSPDRGSNPAQAALEGLQPGPAQLCAGGRSSAKPAPGLVVGTALGTAGTIAQGGQTLGSQDGPAPDLPLAGTRGPSLPQGIGSARGPAAQAPVLAPGTATGHAMTQGSGGATAAGAPADPAPVVALDVATGHATPQGSGGAAAVGAPADPAPEPGPAGGASASIRADSGALAGTPQVTASLSPALLCNSTFTGVLGPWRVMYTSVCAHVRSPSVRACSGRCPAVPQAGTALC